MTTLSLALIGALSISLIMIVGGIWITLSQRIIVDENGNVTEISLPIFGKMKTNFPGLISIFIGAALATYAINKAPIELDKIPLEITIKVPESGGAGGIIAGAIPNRYLKPIGSFTTSRTANVSLDVDRPDTYTVVALQLLKVDEDGATAYRVRYGPTVSIEKPEGIQFAADFGVEP